MSKKDSEKAQKQPWAEVKIVCPHCKTGLDVKIERERVGPLPVKPEWVLKPTVEPLLPGMADEESAAKTA